MQVLGLVVSGVVLCATPLLAQLVFDQEPDDRYETKTLSITMNGEPRTSGVMLDGNWRWIHTADWASCDGNESAYEQCYVQGLDAAAYEDTYGVRVSEDDGSITLKYANSASGGSPAYGQRVYLTDMSVDGGDGYQVRDRVVVTRRARTPHTYHFLIVIRRVARQPAV